MHRSARLPPLILAAFTSPNFAFAFVMAPATAFLPNIYATETAVSLTAIGIVLMVSRIFDAVADQLIGYWSDRTRGPFGPRKPWLIAGAPLMLLSVPFLFNPPPNADVFYFAAWSLVFYFGYTCIYVPHLAWASELSSDYNERSRVFTYYIQVGTIGQLLMFGGPMALHHLGYLSSSEIDAPFMQVLTIAFFITLPLSIVLTVWKTPVGAKPPLTTVSFRSMLASLRHNTLLLRYMAALLLYGLGQGVFASLIVVYFDSYLGLADKVSLVFLGIIVITIVTLPPWMEAVKRFGKHRPWAVSWIGSVLTTPLLFFCGTGPDAFIPVLIIFWIWGAWEAVSNVVAQSLLGDVIDYDTFKSGTEKAGSFFALQGLIVKFSSAFGSGGAFVLLDIFHYSIRDPSTNTPGENFALLATFILVPTVLKAMAVPLIWSFPLDERRHGVVRKRLAQRAERAARAQTVAPTT